MPKDPAKRKHIWEREQRADEVPVAAAEPDDDPYPVPRYVRKPNPAAPDGIEHKYVETKEQRDAAVKDGYEL